MGVGGSFGLSKSGSKSKSSSEYGLPVAQRLQAFNTFFPTFQQLPSFLNQLGGITAPSLNLAPSGLTLGQQGQAQNLLSDTIRRQNTLVSSAAALRGQTSPLNLGGIINDASSRALARVLPQTLQLAGQNEQFNAAVPFQNTLNQFQTMFSVFDRIAQLFQGGSSKSKGKGGGFQFNVGGGQVT